MTPSTDNIQALLADLQEGSLAHELVSLIRDLPPDQWDSAIQERIRSFIQEEVARVRDAKDQEH